MKNTTNSTRSSSLIRRTIGQTLLVSSLVAVATTGCAQDESQGPEGLQSAIPTANQLAVKLPRGQSRAIGDLAELYVDTREIADEINGSVAWALELVHSVIQAPAHAVNGSVSSWGPWVGGGVEYKVEVTELAAGGYEFRLLGRAAGTSGSYETLLSGATTPGATADSPRGRLTVDFDADDRVLPSHHAQTGKVDIKYDLAQRSLEVEVSARQGGSTSTIRHTYKGSADGGGELLFLVRQNEQSVSVRSRWQAGGAGRGDARITSGVANEPEVTTSECWDSQFRLTYSQSQVGPINDTEGSAASCVFTTAELPPRS